MGASCKMQNYAVDQWEIQLTMVLADRISFGQLTRFLNLTES